MKKITWIPFLAAVLLILTGMVSASDVECYVYPTEINPLYEGLIELEEESIVSFSSTGTDYIAEVFYNTYEEAGAALRQGLVNRQSLITVGLAVTGSYDKDEIRYALFYEAMKHTGMPVEGDYLAWQWTKRGFLVKTQSEGDVHYISVNYSMIYHDTAAQEAKMDEAVKALLDELNLYDADDYTKIRGIYDYICANVAYDYENMSDTSYMLKYTGYAALVNKTAVCQGYAVLFYRLVLELGVDARIIFGTAGSVNHTWNIARLGDTYFCLDGTWDAGKTVYSCFLKSENHFSGHTRGTNPQCNMDYTSAAFYAAYPIGETDYIPIAIPGGSVSGTCGDSLLWKLEEDGRLVIYGTGDMEDYTVSVAPWSEYAASVREIVVSDGVTGIGAYAFWDCTALNKVCLPASVVSVGPDAFPADVSVWYPTVVLMTLVSDSAYRIVTGEDGSRCLVTASEGMDIITFAENFTDGTNAASNLFQLVSADGSDRYTSLDTVKFGMKFQRLDENGSVADEVMVVRKGDVNLDGAVTEADAVLLMWSFMKPEEYSYILQYDINGDGLTNAADAVYILSELIK